MNGVSRHLRASSLPSLIRGYGGGINSVRRFSSQSDGFSEGRVTEQGAVPGDTENNNSGIPNSSPSSLRSISDLKASLRNMRANGFSAPNAPPPTFKNLAPKRPSSYGNFTQSPLLKENSPTGKKSSDLENLRDILSFP